MKARPTPGPWAAIDWNCKARTTIVSDYCGNRTVVAECSGNGRLASDSLADALLIAAAPDLLAAAGAAWNCIAELPPTQARVEVAQMLFAAIAKATGGEE